MTLSLLHFTLIHTHIFVPSSLLSLHLLYISPSTPSLVPTPHAPSSEKWSGERS